MKARAFSGVCVALTAAKGADHAQGSRTEQAIQYQPVLHYGFDEPDCWLARLSAAPAVRINWRERR